MTVTFKFDLHQRVRVLVGHYAGQEGEVVKLCVFTDHGWTNAVRLSPGTYAWFNDDEIEAA